MGKRGESKSVNPGSLHSLFERLFGADDEPSGSDCAHPAADLVVRLDDGWDGGGELDGSPERSIALLAAYFDGGLDDAAQQEVAARLAQSPTAYHDAAGADAFLAAVAGAQSTAPADLVASTISRVRPSLAPMARRRSILWKWSAALAVLAAAIAVVVIFTHQPMPADKSVPITAKTAPTDALPAPMLAQPHAPASPSSPAVAGKTTPHPAMLPAGSEETVRRPGARPQFAPETEDSVPPLTQRTK